MITILLIVLSADPASDAPSSAMAAAMADGLGTHGHVALERVSALPSDAEADARAKAVSAEGVAEVSWPSTGANGDANGAGRRAHLHVHVPSNATWIDRDLDFDATSPGWERGRAVGLAIAAMFPDESEPPPAEPPETPVAKAVALEPTTPTKDETTPTPPTSPLRRSPFELGLFGELGPSFDDQTTAAGGRVDATWWVSRVFGVRAVAGARWSSLAGLATRVAHVDAGLGVAARVIGADEPFSITLRGELRIAHESLMRARDDGIDEHRGHTLPVAALLVEGSYRVTPHFSVGGFLGTEIALGTTEVEVNGANAGELPTFTLIGALGVRWSL